MRAKLLTILLLTSCLGFITAGPFGISMGQSLESLENDGLSPSPIANNIGYYYVTPQNTHPNFEQYLVRIDQEEGVFFIKAIGKDIQDNGYGTSTKAEFEELRKAIEGTYGPSKLVEFLFPNSIWDEPDDWMMGIRQGERFHIAQWKKADGSPFPGEIAEILLGVTAVSSSQSYLGLEYYGTNHGVLSEKASKAAAHVF